MQKDIAPRIVVQKDLCLDGYLHGRSYHLTKRVSKTYVSRLHPAIIVPGPEYVYLDELGMGGLKLMRKLFGVYPEEMYFNSHSVALYFKEPDWEKLEPLILEILKEEFPNPEKVEVVLEYSEGLCHPEDTYNNKSLAPA